MWYRMYIGIWYGLGVYWAFCWRRCFFFFSRFFRPLILFFNTLLMACCIFTKSFALTCEVMRVLGGNDLPPYSVWPSCYRSSRWWHESNIFVRWFVWDQACWALIWSRLWLHVSQSQVFHYIPALKDICTEPDSLCLSKSCPSLTMNTSLSWGMESDSCNLGSPLVLALQGPACQLPSITRSICIRKWI